MSATSLGSKISFLVASLNKQLEMEIERQMLPLKLPVDQLRVLETLAGATDGQGLMMSEIAKAVVIDPSTLTKVVGRMVSDSLVYRTSDPNDRRRVKILLTPKGTALFGRLRPLLDKQNEKIAKTAESVLNGADSRSVLDLFDQMRREAWLEDEQHNPA